jgi:hypothetical protein
LSQIICDGAIDMQPAQKTASATVTAAAHDRSAQRPTLDISHAKADLPTATALQKMAAETATSPLKVMRDYASLAFGPGRVSFRDYTNLRLFDEVRYAGIDKRTVVGVRRNRDIAVEVNYRHDWYGIVENKIAANAYLSAFGLPTIPSTAIYTEKLGTAAPNLLRSRDELGAFLRRDDVYPLFGKPAEGLQSLGSAGLARYSGADDRIERTDGETIGVDAFVEDVVAHYASGYLFQPLTSPHRDVVALCGDRLATCRMLTLNTVGGPQLYRAVWKIPAGGNAADNYWRPGNILARIDLASGCIEAAMTGAGFDFKEVTHHPDTGARLIGAKVPNWDAMKATSVEGARLMRQVPMIGWDMASGPDGAIIVEMNQTPDVFLNQLADIRGLLEPEFLAFMAFQKRNEAAHLRIVRTAVAKL